MSDHSEYRVVWQREGLGRKVAIRQTLAGAEKLSLTLQGRIEEATGYPAEAYACCGGDDCSCGGETNAEMWARKSRMLPPLVVVPVIEARKVGPWAALDGAETNE